MSVARVARRLPVGAGGAARRAACTSASGRRGGRASRSCSKGRRAEGRRAGGGARRLLLRRCRSAPARARSTASASTATTTSTRTRPRASSRTGRTAPRGRRPVAFRWTDGGWRGAALEGQVIYEMHVGTFTPEGTWAAARARAAGAGRARHHVLEMMPVAEFPGRFGWGYDGVNLFAPTRLYGAPDDLRALRRSRARARPRRHPRRRLQPPRPGRQLPRRSSRTTTSPTRYKNDWGEALNFDGPDAAPVREFFVANARYWIDEFHLDGLRLDATQDIYDDSAEHILAAIARAVRAAAARARRRSSSAENEPQETRLVRAAGARRLRPRRALERRLPSQRARRADRAAARPTTRDYTGTPQEFISAVEVRLPVSGAVVRLAEAAARHAGARPAARRRSSTSSRTTTRSRTPRAASACTS